MPADDLGALLGQLNTGQMSKQSDAAGPARPQGRPSEQPAAAGAVSPVGDATASGALRTAGPAESGNGDVADIASHQAATVATSGVVGGRASDGPHTDCPRVRVSAGSTVELAAPAVPVGDTQPEAASGASAGLAITATTEAAVSATAAAPDGLTAGHGSSGSAGLADSGGPVLRTSGGSGVRDYAAVAPPEIGTSRLPQCALPQSGTAAVGERAPSVVPDPQVARRPKWSTFEEKSVLFRPGADALPGQVDDLRTLARSLQRRRVSKTERITENTLIRVAVDLLLAVQDRLHGDTEEQLRHSLLGGGGSD